MAPYINADPSVCNDERLAHRELGLVLGRKPHIQVEGGAPQIPQGRNVQQQHMLVASEAHLRMPEQW